MEAHSLMDQFEGNGQDRISFEEIDQRYHLKMRAFVKLCMAPVFGDLEKRFRLSTMRTRGITPIMFHLTFENTDIPIVFMSTARMTHQVRLCRSITPSPKGPPVERLLLDMRIQIHAPRGSGDPLKLGSAEQGTAEVEVARMRGLQVLTRPVAPPNERQVIQVPPELAQLREHILEEAFPVPEHLLPIPGGYVEASAGRFPHHDTVWGLPNTDINQHVNVHEYIYGMENHFSRRLHGAGLPLPKHRIAKAQLLFRKPFFPGDLVRIGGPLHLKETQTLLTGGYYRFDAQGLPEARPSVAVRMEGVLDSPASQLGGANVSK